MKTLLVALFAMGICLARSPARAQQPQRLPPVRVQSTFLDRPGYWPDSARVAMRDSIAHAREKWMRTRPSQYLVATIATWMMTRPPQDSSRDGKLEAFRVHDDSIVATIRRRAPQYTPAPVWTRATVDAVFRVLDATVTNRSRKVVSVTFDSAWGYPRAWVTDDVRPITEQTAGGAVVFFEPVSDRGCAWWRRSLRRCTFDR